MVLHLSAIVGTGHRAAERDVSRVGQAFQPDVTPERLNSLQISATGPEIRPAATENCQNPAIVRIDRTLATVAWTTTGYDRVIDPIDPINPTLATVSWTTTGYCPAIDPIDPIEPTVTFVYRATTDSDSMTDTVDRQMLLSIDQQICRPKPITAPKPNQTTPTRASPETKQLPPEVPRA